MHRVLLAAAFVVLWSSGFVGTTLAGDAPPEAVLAWRYLVTAVILVAIVGRATVRLTRRDVGRQVIIGLLAHGVFLGGVFAAAAVGVDPGTTALVAALQPMLVALAGRVWWRDRLRPLQLGGLALGLLAVLIAGGPGDGGPPSALLLPLASVLGLTGAALLERRWRTDVPIGPALTVQVITAMIVFGAVAVGRRTIVVEPTRDVIIAVGWLVILSGLGGYAAYTLCLRRLGAATTSTLLYLTPSITVLWTWLGFGAVPTGRQLVGLALGGLAVAAFVLGARVSPRTAARRPSPSGGPGRARPPGSAGASCAGPAGCPTPDSRPAPP